MGGNFFSAFIYRSVKNRQNYLRINNLSMDMNELCNLTIEDILHYYNN